jgi:hypothetical protein
MEKRRIFDRDKGNIMLATQENAFDLGILFLANDHTVTVL